MSTPPHHPDYYYNPETLPELPAILLWVLFICITTMLCINIWITRSTSESPATSHVSPLLPQEQDLERQAQLEFPNADFRVVAVRYRDVDSDCEEYGDDGRLIPLPREEDDEHDMMIMHQYGTF